MRITTLILALALGGMLSAEEGADAPATEAPAVTAYPLTTCIVGGEALDSKGEPVVMVHEGQEVKFCCKKCKKTFKEDPDSYLAKLVEADSEEAAEEAPEDSAPAEQAAEGQATAEAAGESGEAKAAAAKAE